MSIGISMTAKCAKPAAVQQALQTLAQQHGYPCSGDEQSSQVHFCRMGDLYFTFEPAKKGLFQKAGLSATATTSLVGAGFHAAVVAFLDELAKLAGFSPEVDDETDYYTHRDFKRMREEHFYNWLSQLVTVSRERSQDGTYSSLCLCWDLDQYEPEVISGTVVTPFGRFEIAEMVQQVESEGIASLARDFFFWNEPEQDARFFRNTALAILWEDCYFAPSVRSEEDAAINGEAIRLLEESARRDPSIPFPKAVYQEVCALDEHSPIPLDGLTDFPSRTPVGYRKGIVSHKLGNLRIPIGGNYLFRFDDDGRHSDFVWYDEAEDWHTLRATAFRCNSGDAEFAEKLFDNAQEEYTEFQTGDGRCRTAFAGEVEEDGMVYYQSIAQVVSGPQATLITLSYANPEGRLWASGLLRGIRCKL